MRYLALACDYDGTLAAEGRVPPETVGALERLRAQNLVLFLQLSDGVDDVTWLYHRRQGDYSRWFHADLYAIFSLTARSCAPASPDANILNFS